MKQNRRINLPPGMHKYQEDHGHIQAESIETKSMRKRTLHIGQTATPYGHLKVLTNKHQEKKTIPYSKTRKIKRI